MELRNISLTLEKAKEWYNSGNEALKEAALQAYTEDELKTVHFSEIKSFEDACKALGIPEQAADYVLNNIGAGLISKHLTAIYKLDIICKALNMGWKPSLVEGKVYWPYVRFYPAGDKAREAARSNNWKVHQSFYSDGKKYSLVSGGDVNYCDGGLGYFGFGCWDAHPYLGLLSCKSREIAEHMSAYFAKEIFEACYAQHVGTYEWV